MIEGAVFFLILSNGWAYYKLAKIQTEQEVLKKFVGDVFTKAAKHYETQRLFMDAVLDQLDRRTKCEP